MASCLCDIWHSDCSFPLPFSWPLSRHSWPFSFHWGQAACFLTPSFYAQGTAVTPKPSFLGEVTWWSEKNLGSGVLKTWLIYWVYWTLLWANYWHQLFIPHSNCVRGHHTISQMRRLRPRKTRDSPNISQVGSGRVSLKPGQSGCRSHSPNHSSNCLSKCRAPGSYCQIHVFGSDMSVISSTCLVP